MNRMFGNMGKAAEAWREKHPRMTNFLINSSFVWMYVLYYAFFIVIPFELFLCGVSQSAQFGPAGESITLLPWVKLMWAATIPAMFVLSAIAAGLQKWILSQFGRWSLLPGVAVAAIFLLAWAQKFADVAGRLDRLRGDNALLAAFLGAWLMVIGYLSKLPWDEARDRWFRHIDREGQRRQEKRHGADTTRADCPR